MGESQTCPCYPLSPLEFLHIYLYIDRSKMESSLCRYRKRNGQQCQRHASSYAHDNPKFCWQHQIHQKGSGEVQPNRLGVGPMVVSLGLLLNVSICPVSIKSMKMMS